MILDVQTAIDALDVGGAVGVMGFCMGGSLAYLAATRLTGLADAVAYCGSWIREHADEVPRVPVLSESSQKKDRPKGIRPVRV